MTFKSFESILSPDPRFADLCGVRSGTPRPMTLRDLHGWMAEIEIVDSAPDAVRVAFDRVRNVMVLAFFDYELLVVGATEACGVFELALKFKLNGHGGQTFGALGKLVTRARQSGLLPATVTGTSTLDPLDALIAVRNGRAHGTSDVHSPGMAVGVVATVAQWINHLLAASHAPAR